MTKASSSSSSKRIATTTTVGWWSCMLLLIVGSCCMIPSSVHGGVILETEERLQKYRERNYTWPIPKYIPDTPGWTKLLDERFAQIAEMKNRNFRYDGYRHLMSAAIVAQNFTEYGFGLARAPSDLMSDLRQAIRDGLAKGPREEGDIAVIHGDIPWFIDRPDLTKRVLNEMLPYAEEWSGVKLTPATAYGFRLYRNGNQLTMHSDKSLTHIISFILHIDSSDDAEPWPIFIEDFHGRTHEVTLTSGDVLFYESSKCFHGRVKPLKGSWYTSIFVHYYPVDWQSINHDEECHYAIPPHWIEDPVYDVPQHEPITMSGMSFVEPNCNYGWCRVPEAIQWSGPGLEGYVLEPDNKKRPFHPKVASTVATEE